MFKTLYGKIAAILFGLFLLVGVLFIYLTLHITRLHVQEVGQGLNREVAEYLVSQKFFIQDGKANQKALKESFEVLMHINPNIELYLLDPQGAILAYSAPPGKVKLNHVTLEPVRSFLSGEARYPILGDDPRNPGRQKIFNVSPIPREGPREGYLYVILGGEEYDSVAGMLRTSYILRLSLGIGVAGSIFALLFGLFLVFLLTRRLRRLAAGMERFKSGDFKEPVVFSDHFDKVSGDEIDRLAVVFEEMSTRIIEQMDKVRQADNLRRELVSNISHDLRTPLTSLHGYLETMLLKGEGLPEAERREFLTNAIRHSERLSKLVSELFELSKLNAKETKPVFEQFHAGELVQDILQKFRLDAEKRKVRLSAAFPKNLPLASADLRLFERAIQNLIENALRYTRKGGTVTVSLLPDDGRVRVQVSDEGPGISEEDIPYIFDRFYTARKNDAESLENSGLGLAITKRIVELHGSLIEASSEASRGTTFTFFLPVPPSVPPA